MDAVLGDRPSTRPTVLIDTLGTEPAPALRQSDEFQQEEDSQELSQDYSLPYGELIATSILGVTSLDNIGSPVPESDITIAEDGTCPTVLPIYSRKAADEKEKQRNVLIKQW